YFPFNDRDYTSVAELMMVPGCSPGLFTKQFVEFAPSQTNNWNIFAAVIPQRIPTYSPPPTGGPSPTLRGGTLQGAAVAGHSPTGLTGAGTKINTVQAFQTGSTPFQYVAAAGAIQPRTFPYLNDQFFYTGFGGGTTIDPGNQVGGYAADGWFK